jgi:hypothetical protein
MMEEFGVAGPVELRIVLTRRLKPKVSGFCTFKDVRTPSLRSATSTTK